MIRDGKHYSTRGWNRFRERMGWKRKTSPVWLRRRRQGFWWDGMTAPFHIHRVDWECRRRASQTISKQEP